MPPSVPTKQHFIPRFLINWFDPRRWMVNGDDPGLTVYCFRKGKQPPRGREKSRSVGYERFFYGKEEDAAIEREFACREGEFGELLARLNMRGSVDEDRLLITEFVAHLVIRTQAFRQAISRQMDEYFDAIKNDADNPKEHAISARWIRMQIRKQFIQLLEQENRPIPAEKINIIVNALGDIAKIIMPQINGFMLGRRHFEESQIPRDKVQSRIEQMMIDLGLDPKLPIYLPPEVTLPEMPSLAEIVNHVVEVQNERLVSDRIAREGHLRALSQAVIPEKRVQELARLAWRVIEGKEWDYILGDIGPLAMTREREFILPIKADPEPYCILLPISDRRLLVGTDPNERTIGLWTVDEINNASAEMSQSFFISSQCTDKEIELHKRIGLRADLFTTPETKAVVKEVLEEMVRDFSGDDDWPGFPEKS